MASRRNRNRKYDQPAKKDVCLKTYRQFRLQFSSGDVFIRTLYIATGL